MRHRVAGFKLGRDTEHRIAMWRNMAVALFTHGQITTTVTKARSIRPLVEKLITAAKQNNLASRRRVIRALGDPLVIDFDPKDLDKQDLQVKRSEGYRINSYREVLDGPRVVKKLFDEIAPRYADRAGGYTRIVRLGMHRVGDGADLCVLQLVGDEQGPQVSGQYSRRREKANRRMEFAARLRKSKAQSQPEPQQAATPAEDESEATEQAVEKSDAGQEKPAENTEDRQSE